MPMFNSLKIKKRAQQAHLAQQNRKFDSCSSREKISRKWDLIIWDLFSSLESTKGKKKERERDARRGFMKTH